MLVILSIRRFKMAVVAICLLAWSSSPVLADVVTFDWVTVGNPGNGGDVQANGTFGSVGYTYRISKHEVTNSQYTAFLNAVAATDSRGLYNLNMGTHQHRGGITRNGSPGSYNYSVIPNMGNKPVNWVTFFDAMRFTNWLQNGQGMGSTESGVYTMGTGLSEIRAPGAIYFIPSEDEWYKAAYHKNDGVTGNYFEYPASSDTVPTQATANAIGDISNPGTNVANYSRGANWDSHANVTTVGSAGANSASPYGTFDQGGNLTEWNEAVNFTHPFRGQRGGNWNSGTSPATGFVYLAATMRAGNIPSDDGSTVGFRVASVPATVVAPDSFSVTRGAYVSGGLPELSTSDNMDLTLWRRNADLQSQTEFEVKSTSPNATPASFEFTLEGSVLARGNVVQTIELFNYVAAAWELVRTTDASRAPAPDSVVTAGVTGDLSRFVEAGTMCIEARIRYKIDSNRKTFASNTDQAVWTIVE